MINKLLFLLLPLLFLGGCSVPPELHYKDCVRIEDKFYGPTYGTVIKYHGFNSYVVLRKIDNETSQWTVGLRAMTKVSDSHCSN